MKKILYLSFAVVLLAAGIVYAAASGGTVMTDANLFPTSMIGWDSTKTITATVTGTKPAFSDQTLAAGTHALQIICVNPTTGALAAGRVKFNNAGTEVALYGVMHPFVVTRSTTSLAFTKYSTATATDSVKCTAVGN